MKFFKSIRWQLLLWHGLLLLLGSTRKYVVPIITRLDADGVTRRRGDDRIAGPRATDYSSGG